MDNIEGFPQEVETNMILSLESEFDILGIDEEHDYKVDDSMLFSFHHNEDADEKPDAKNHSSNHTALTEDVSVDDTDHEASFHSSSHHNLVTPAKVSSASKVGGASDEETPKRSGSPTKLDVLCGQSRSCAAHDGNKRFQAVLDMYAPKYSSVHSKQEKMNLTKEIVACITTSGGRFLKLKGGEWQEISTVAARDKVSHALRTKVASWKKQEQEKAESSPVATSKGRRPGHRRRTSAGSRKPRRNSSQSSIHSTSSEIATVSFDGSDPSSNALIEDLLKTQREIFANLQKENGNKGEEHPLKRESR